MTLYSYGDWIHVCSCFDKGKNFCGFLGPVVQNMGNLTSSLEIKMLTDLVRTISNSQLRNFAEKKSE